MLQKLGDHIKSCLRHSDECRAAAGLLPMRRPRATESPRRLLSGRMWPRPTSKPERFLLDAQRNKLPKEVERLPGDAIGESSKS